MSLNLKYKVFELNGEYYSLENIIDIDYNELNWDSTSKYYTIRIIYYKYEKIKYERVEMSKEMKMSKVDSQKIVDMLLEYKQDVILKYEPES